MLDRRKFILTAGGLAGAAAGGGLWASLVRDGVENAAGPAVPADATTSTTTRPPSPSGRWCRRRAGSGGARAGRRQRRTEHPRSGRRVLPVGPADDRDTRVRRRRPDGNRRVRAAPRARSPDRTVGGRRPRRDRGGRDGRTIAVALQGHGHLVVGDPWCRFDHRVARPVARRHPRGRARSTAGDRSRGWLTRPGRRVQPLDRRSLSGPVPAPDDRSDRHRCHGGRLHGHRRTPRDRSGAGCGSGRDPVHPRGGRPVRRGDGWL